MTVIYVDYFIHTGTKLFEENVIKKLYQLFEIGKTAAVSFKYIELNVLNYPESIDFITISPERKSQKYHNQTSVKEQHFRLVIDQVNWLTSQTRLDISFGMLNLSCNIKGSPTVNELIEANAMIKKIKNRGSKLVFSKLGTVDDLKLVICFIC